MGTGPVVASVVADPFELFRCLGGRRTDEQVRALGWSGRPEVVLPYVSAY